MAKVIVGIHGLANKPAPDVLKDWWETAIREGLVKNCDVGSASVSFHMGYWAGLLYSFSQPRDESGGVGEL